MMPKTALPAIHITTKTRVVVEADHDLYQKLLSYQAFYEHVHSVKVAEAVLVRAMASSFMDGDRDFQAFRRKQTQGRRRKPPLTPAAGAADA